MELTIGVYEVYSEGGGNCIMFLTNEEAKEQIFISPSDGPYEAKVAMTREEYCELREKRYMWC